MKPAPFDYFAPTTVDDVLCYTTKPLERPTEVTGPIELVLFASSPRVIPISPLSSSMSIPMAAPRLSRQYVPFVPAPTHH